MENKERVIKHLEIIQGVINRLGHDSFLLKGWSMTLLAVIIVFITKNEIQCTWFVLVLLIPIIGFWFLDGYFVRLERLFRATYNDIRKMEDTDFVMDITKYKNHPKCKWLSSIFSLTLNVFYGIEVLFVLAIYIAMIGG